jgi:hypothetical protein
VPGFEQLHAQLELQGAGQDHFSGQNLEHNGFPHGDDKATDRGESRRPLTEGESDVLRSGDGTFADVRQDGEPLELPNVSEQDSVLHAVLVHWPRANLALSGARSLLSALQVEKGPYMTSKSCKILFLVLKLHRFSKWMVLRFLCCVMTL